MKFYKRKSLFTSLFILVIVGVSLCLGSPKPKPSPDKHDHLSNADLHHLLSLLDDNESETVDSPSINPSILINDLEESARDIFGIRSDINDVHELETRVTTTPESILPKFPKRILIKRPRLTTTTTETPTTTEVILETTSQTTDESIPKTFAQPIKREDTNVENLKFVPQPSQQDLVQQLSLLNSLLISLGDNVTANGGPTNVPAIEKQDNLKPTPDINELLKSLTESANTSTTYPVQDKIPAKTNDPAATLQSLALLSSLFGNGNPNSNPTAAALLGTGSYGTSNVATRQTPGKVQSDAEALAALTEFIKQNQAGQNGNPLMQNFKNTNGNMDTASSNQIASLLSLLGTLGSLSQPQQQQSNPLFNFGQNNAVEPQQLNFLTTLLGNQQPSPQPNALGNLFGAASQPQSQAFNLGNIFAAQNTAPGLGLLSTVGSLGSSLVSVMSNILGGSSLGGKPRVRGKGVDTRVGVGYRLGDQADAQIVWDIGPQLFTDPIRNEVRPPMMNSKSQQVDSTQHLVNTQARAEKHQQQVTAAKRFLQVQMQKEMQNHHFNQRRLFLNQFPTTKKPLSLLDMWNLGKSDYSVTRRTQIPEQLLMPPMQWNTQDTLQMLRRKSFMKRSSPQDLKPYYSKPNDDPTEGHNTLTNYEKMLLKHGTDYGEIEKDRKNEQIKSKPTLPWDLKEPLITEEESGPRPPPRRRNKKTPFLFRAFSKFPNRRRRPQKNRESLMEKPSETREKYREESQEKINHNERPRENKNNYFDEASNNINKYTDRPPQGSREQFKDRPQQNREQFNDGPQQNREQFNEEPQQNREQFNEEPQQNREQFNEEPQQNREQFNEEPQRNREQFKDRPQQNREQFKDRPQQNREQFNEGPQRNREQFNDGPQRNRERFNDGPSNNRNKFNDRPPKESRERFHNRPHENRNQLNDRPRENQEKYWSKENRERLRNDEHSVAGSEMHETRYQERPSQSSFNKQMGPRRRTSGFSLSNLFQRLRGPRPSRKRPMRKPADRRFTDNNSRFQEFSNTNDEMEMSDSKDNFYTRNSPSGFKEDQSFNSFAKKTSRQQNIERSSLSHSTRDAFRRSSSHDPDVETNPEAEDSFIRRNAVVINPQLLTAEKNKIFQMKHSSHPPFSSNNETTTRRKDNDDDETDVSENKNPSQKKSVMSYLKNFLSKKTRTKSSNSSNTGITSLRTILSDSSTLLNSMKILPGRRQNPPKESNTKTKLVIVNGKPQIINATTETTQSKIKEEESIVHVGEDMSMEDLTSLFGIGKNSTEGKKKRKKLKLKLKNAESRKDEDIEINLSEKIDQDQEDAKKAKDDKEVEEEEEEDNDGLKGIFIDIESGEVNVLKPVASLTSFEPKKEPSEEEYDEYEDGDGDGIADADMKRKQAIFDDIQTELKKNYDKMKKAHLKAEAKKRRKEELVSKGMDESMDVVSKYFDMVDETDDSKPKTKPNLKTKTRL